MQERYCPNKTCNFLPFPKPQSWFSLVNIGTEIVCGKQGWMASLNPKFYKHDKNSLRNNRLAVLSWTSNLAKVDFIGIHLKFASRLERR